MRQSGVVTYEVSLGDLGEFDDVRIAMLEGNKLFERRRRNARGAQLKRRPAGNRHLEDGGLDLVSENWRRRRAAARQ